MKKDNCCQICGESLEEKRKYCGSQREKTSCAYKALLLYGETDRGREVARRSREKRKDKIAAYYKEWYRLGGRKRNPTAQKAHKLVLMAINSGKLKKPKKCQICSTGAHRIEGHHEDYSKPLEVEWLCQPCHKKKHRTI